VVGQLFSFEKDTSGIVPQAEGVTLVRTFGVQPETTHPENALFPKMAVGESSLTLHGHYYPTGRDL
jgi:hypothetical protein